MMKLFVAALFLVASTAIPTKNFTGEMAQYVSSNLWCQQCKAFSSQCALTCAGDPSGGPCPDTACPSVFSFFNQGTSPVWQINISKSDNPYRAFSYVPLCNNNECADPFVFRFSFKYIGLSTFSSGSEYLKLLFWGDGNNILGVKGGKLVGLPGGGTSDLVGNTAVTGIVLGDIAPDTWVNFDLTIIYSNLTIAFTVNGVPKGSGKINSASNSGLQFGVYVWGGPFFVVQYKDIGIYSTTSLPTSAPTSAPNSNPSNLTPNSASSLQACGLFALLSLLAAY